MIGTMPSFFIVALLCLVGWSNSQRCPAKYLRFTPQHSYCLPPNPSCHVTRTGVTEQDKELILKLHNEFRSTVAMGNEHRSRGHLSLPQAADMLEMEWDDELAAVAQKWAQNCQWGHDCDECRAVENFAVGQNLAITNWTRHPTNVPDWTESLTRLYNEVLNYDRNWLSSYKKHPGPKTGHLTQLIWSRSWKVGCGYAYYQQGSTFHQYYACNYGPGGNVKGESVYKQGRPCSACPINSQCSSSFPGLCKMYNPNIAPIFPRNQGLLFYCGFLVSDVDCRADVSGDGSWKTVESVGGNYESIVLEGGQSTTVAFKSPIIPRGDAFCLTLKFRKGPLDASRRDQSSFQAYCKMGYSFSGPTDLDTGTTTFIDYKLDLPWGKKTEFSYTFSVPKGAGSHILDIRKIVATDGPCA